MHLVTCSSDVIVLASVCPSASPRATGRPSFKTCRCSRARCVIIRGPSLREQPPPRFRCTLGDRQPHRTSLWRRGRAAEKAVISAMFSNRGLEQDRLVAAEGGHCYFSTAVVLAVAHELTRHRASCRTISVPTSSRGRPWEGNMRPT